MNARQPSVLTIVSCAIVRKPEDKPRDEMTEFDVTVKIGESGAPFRLRTERGMPIKPINFGYAASLQSITELLTEGAEISVRLSMVGARWQSQEDDFRSSDRAVNPKEIKPIGRRLTAPSTVTASTPHTAPVPGTLLFNAGDKMGSRAV